MFRNAWRSGNAMPWRPQTIMMGASPAPAQAHGKVASESVDGCNPMIEKVIQATFATGSLAEMAYNVD